MQRDAVGLVTFDEQIAEYVPARYRPGHMHRLMVCLERAVAGVERIVQRLQHLQQTESTLQNLHNTQLHTAHHLQHLQQTESTLQNLQNTL